MPVPSPMIQYRNINPFRARCGSKFALQTPQLLPAALADILPCEICVYPKIKYIENLGTCSGTMEVKHPSPWPEYIFAEVTDSTIPDYAAGVTFAMKGDDPFTLYTSALEDGDIGPLDFAGVAYTHLGTPTVVGSNAQYGLTIGCRYGLVNPGFSNIVAEAFGDPGNSNCSMNLRYTGSAPGTPGDVITTTCYGYNTVESLLNDPFDFEFFMDVFAPCSGSICYVYLGTLTIRITE